MHINTKRRARALLTSAAAAALLFGTAACSDDDDADAAADSPATTHPADHTAAPVTTAGDTAAPSAEVAAFCEADLAAEAAVFEGDPATIQPAFEALVAAAPEDIKPTVEAVVANAESGPGDPAFDEPYGEMIEYVSASCGYATLALTGTEYAFGGLPAEVAAGGTVISLENIGEEVHEIMLMRVDDGVTETAEELLALPEDELETMVSQAGGAFAMPGASGHSVVDLEPGRHIALCFVPEGGTPEILMQMEGPEDTLPAGVELGGPHFTLGMIHEFEVLP